MGNYFFIGILFHFLFKNMTLFIITSTTIKINSFRSIARLFTVLPLFSFISVVLPYPDDDGQYKDDQHTEADQCGDFHRFYFLKLRLHS